MAAAATRYRVNARAAEGFKDYRRAGIAWPRGAGRYLEVLVTDQPEDPPGRQLDGHLAVGQNTWAAVNADPHLFADVMVEGGVAGDDAEKVSLRARVVELEQLLEKATNPGGGDDGKSKGKGKGRRKGLIDGVALL